MWTLCLLIIWRYFLYCSFIKYIFIFVKYLNPFFDYIFVKANFLFHFLFQKSFFFTFNSYNPFFTLVFLSQQLLLILCLSLLRSYTPFNFGIWVFFDPTVPLISVFEYILILQSLQFQYLSIFWSYRPFNFSI